MYRASSTSRAPPSRPCAELIRTLVPVSLMWDVVAVHEILRHDVHGGFARWWAGPGLVNHGLEPKGCIRAPSRDRDPPMNVEVTPKP